MKITFWGAARTVTGYCCMLEVGATKLLVDCGMFQGNKKLTIRNVRDFPFQPQDIDYLLLTHAHIDHSGLIPKLCKKGFKGTIYASEATRDLCSIMLPDSGHIQEVEAQSKTRKQNRRGRKGTVEPIYTTKDAILALRSFAALRYEEELQLTPQIRFRFRDAGHILGSAIIEMWVKETDKEVKLVFSGDLGRGNQPILNDPALIDGADYLFVETTYGKRVQAAEAQVDHLKDIIHDVVKRGGKLIIPAFAVGRTQTLIYHLHNLLHSREIPQVPIYLDSPLAVGATEIFARHPELYDQEAKAIFDAGDKLFDFPKLHVTRSTEESMAINRLDEPAIIISASGMADAGRVLHHLKHNLWRPESTVLFVGYQAEGTLGQRLLGGAARVRIMGEDVAVRAKIETIEGFSAHADQRELLHWIKVMRPSGLALLMHGETEAIEVFAAKVEDELGLATYAPYYGDVLTINGSGDWQVEERLETALADEENEEMRSILLAMDNIYRHYREEVERAMQTKLQQVEFFNRKLLKFKRYMQNLLKK